MWVMGERRFYCAHWGPAKPKSLFAGGYTGRSCILGLKLYLIPFTGISGQPGRVLWIFTLSGCLTLHVAAATIFFFQLEFLGFGCNFVTDVGAELLFMISERV